MDGVLTLIRKFALSLLGCSLALGAQTSFAADDDFPRLAGYMIGNPQNYWDATYQKQLASLDVSIITSYPGWGGSQGYTTDKAVRAIKAINPKTKVFVYVIPEAFKYPVANLWSGLQTKLDTEGWWLSTNKSVISRILSDYGKDTYVLNISQWGKTDSSGERMNTWFASYMVDKVGTPAPSIDGFYTDNVFWKPRRDGDWNMDGKVDSQNDPAIQAGYRAGFVQYLNALRKKMPGKLQLGNIADWGVPKATTPEYTNKWDGGVIEGLIGKSYSVENQGWQQMMTHYRKTMTQFPADNYVMFHMDGSPTDYQTFRYGLASCLMDNAYFAYNNESGYSGVPHFDEYDAKLGAAVSKPSTSAWQNGVYRRDFENGIALVNPKGNGVKEVTLEADFVAIKGTQAPSVNSGKTVRTVKLNDRDGIILMRAKPAKRPAAPLPSVDTGS
jgi:putative glycosyl hydrolase-like family 15 (GHL15) protein